MTRPDGAILSVWNRRHSCWGLPGGKAEDGESVEDAQARELLEETHMVTLMSTHLWTWPTYTGSGRECWVFAVRAVGVPHSDEVGTGVGWMTREFLSKDPITGPWFQEFFAWLDARSP